jgi:hypothetical protein
VLTELRPVLREVGPFLNELNPILNWVGMHSNTVTDMLATLGWGTAATAKSSDPDSPGHYSRQLTPTGPETVAIWPTRLAANRGNSYLNPYSLVGPEAARSLIFPSSDCDNSGEKAAAPGPTGSPACRKQKPLVFQGRPQRDFPHVEADGG